MKTIDPRVKKTRKYLRDSLLTLMKEKGFDAITVRDLTDVAEINRATFYQHFHDKYDLLNQTIDEILYSLGKHVAPKGLEDVTQKEGIIPIFLRLFEFISENAFFFKVMMGENKIPSFQQRLINMVHQFMMEKLDQLFHDSSNMKIPKEIFIHYISYANLGLISYWLESDMKYSAKFMAKQLSELMEKGPFIAIGLKNQV